MYTFDKKKIEHFSNYQRKTKITPRGYGISLNLVILRLKPVFNCFLKGFLM